ncbi:predicted protein [Streptomyces viridosporus ATCC 14672]|uniref:Predicted protein n=1 Tax=Streptomyces viridosporus (strain ATCC 14672 / DSM 40746 / JCM 4963 / KCTC 9882 / NRRL B-12104 / FH 1290) TaxID=566461 RepID=D6A4F0_STRV1|nr:DUF3307 domain-containing protein [Streptomyces viridosporus]EFE65790.1 predicted protein [Streptomyces viridosporus ATCC 14672]
MFAELFALLYVAHLAADYPLQTDHQAAHKADSSAAGWRANLVHAGTHVAACGVALALAAVLLDQSAGVWPSVTALAWIGGTHAFIDRRWPIRWWMENTGQEEFIKHGGAAHVDQAVHVIALAVAALWMAA